MAVDGDQVVGHVLGARGDLDRSRALGVAPLAVAPSHQRRGVGSALMADLLRRADAAGWPMAVLLGDPAYYRRFGFEPSGPLGIHYPPVGEGSPAFQVHRLRRFDPSCAGAFTYAWERPDA